MTARIVHIASNTFREAVRDRVLYNLIAFALLISGAAIFISQISIDVERLVVVNLGLTAECDTSNSALTMSFLLEGGRMAASMALGSPQSRQQMTREQIAFLDALVNQAKIAHQGRQVRISMNITPAMLGARTK